MDRFVFEVIEPFLAKDIEEDRREERVKKVTEELKSFVKGELVPINKELAKKSRELFVASSDIESLKQNVEALEKQGMKLRSEIAMKENEMVRLRMAFERDTEDMKEEIKNRKKEIQQLIKKSQNDLKQVNDEWKEKLIDLKKQLKSQHQAVLQSQKARHEEEVQHMKQTHAAEKQHIIKDNSAEKSKLIKKYEEKVYNLKNESDQTIQKLTLDFNAKIEEIKKSKGELLAKLNTEQMNCRRLTMELEREVGQHNRFKMQFESTFKELQNNRERNENERRRMTKELEETRIALKEMEANLGGRIRALQTELKSTIEQKDGKYNQTVELMNTERRVQVDSLRNNMIEQKQIALNAFEVKSYEQMFQQLKRYQKLQVEFKELQGLYKTVKQSYQVRFRELEHEHQLFVINLQQRQQYERSLSGESAKKEYNNLLNKFTLQIRGLKNQHTIDMQTQQKKYQEEKIALSNKLISQYEGMLSDQRSNTEIQLKQKYVESERKAKAYEKRIGEAEKRKSELKVVIQRMKIEAQMKIQSMMEVNQKLETEIEDLHERILDLQKAKNTLINDYEYQILLLKNEIEKTKEDAKQRQDELRDNLNERIVVKNKEMAKLAEKIKLETDQLVRKNKQRVSLLEKEYEELKRVIKHRTSLPEDIEALKVFHAAYLEKENELIEEKKKREEVQRELHSKQAIDRVFIGKQAFKKVTIIDKLAQTSKGFTVRDRL